MRRLFPLLLALLLLTLTGCQTATPSESPAPSTTSTTAPPQTIPTLRPANNPTLTDSVSWSPGSGKPEQALPGGLTWEELYPNQDDLVLEYTSDDAAFGYHYATYTHKVSGCRYTVCIETGERLTMDKNLSVDHIQTRLSVEELKAIANETFSLLAGVGGIDPTLTLDPDQNGGMYGFVYQRKVGRYPSMEGVSIDITPDGRISRLRTNFLGLFDYLKPSTFREDSLYPALEEAIRNRFTTGYTIHGYAINGQLIGYKDGIWLLRFNCTIEYSAPDGNGQVFTLSFDHTVPIPTDTTT